MQKYHSFLKRMEGSLGNLFSVKTCGSKKATIAVAYILATTLVVLSPDSIYGKKISAITKVQLEAQTLIEEETENAETNQNLLKDPKETYNENHIEAHESQADTDASNTEELIKREEKQEEHNKIDKEAAKKAAEYEKHLEEKEAAKRIAATEEKVAEEKLAEEKAAKEKAAAEEEQAVKEAAEKKKASSKSAGKYSKKEIEILERIVEAEATGGDVKSKILVANVVLNRVKHKSFPNSIEGVVFQKKQFSPIRDGRYYSVSVTKSTKEAVKRAIDGEDYSEGALYFAARKRANKKSMRWFDKNLDNLFAYGGHEFFK